MTPLLIAVTASVAAALLVPGPGRWSPGPRAGSGAGWRAGSDSGAGAGAGTGVGSTAGASGAASGTGSPGWLRRGRLAWATLAGWAALLFVGGPIGVVAGVVTAVGVWLLATRAEPPARRRDRETARRELPHLVGLLGDGMRSGQPAAQALAAAAAALPGPAADRLVGVLPRLRLGVDAGVVWSELAADPDLAPLGRALARAHESGAAAGVSVERLAVDLARSARGEVEDRARSVGVRAAVPLTLCLLPSFVLLGIVPVVAGLLAGLGL